MDNQKTGRLIAQRRKEMGWTQKELGEKLQVSDKTVSKWERGAGFPDISMLEPLADTLGLSVLEVLNGERMRQEESIPAETEKAARSAVKQLGERLRRGAARYRAAAVILIILIVLAAGVYLWWRFGQWNTMHLETREISISEALEAVPFALITREEYRLAWELQEDPEIADAVQRMREEGTRRSELLSEEKTAPCRKLLTFEEGQTADPGTVEIAISGYDAMVDYWEGDRRIILQVIWDGPLVKSSAIYWPNSRKVQIVLNTDNERFELSYDVNGAQPFLFSSRQSISGIVPTAGALAGARERTIT